MNRQKPQLIQVRVQDEHGNDLGVKTIRADQIEPCQGEPKHAALTPQQTDRAKAIWKIIGISIPSLTFDRWADGLRWDADIDRELDIWERIVATLVVVRRDYRSITATVGRTKLFSAVLYELQGGVDTEGVHGVSAELIATVRRVHAGFYSDQDASRRVVYGR